MSKDKKKNKPESTNPLAGGTEPNGAPTTSENPLDAAVDEVNATGGELEETDGDGASVGDASAANGDASANGASDGDDDGNTNNLSAEEKAAKHEQAKTLFGEYRKCASDIESAKKRVGTLSEQKSEIVKKLGAILGNQKFRFDGVETTIVSKDNKATGKATWYFRAKSKEEENMPDFG